MAANVLGGLFRICGTSGRRFAVISIRNLRISSATSRAVGPQTLWTSSVLSQKRITRPTPPVVESMLQVRWSSDAVHSGSLEELSHRVMMVCKAFEKIKAENLTQESHFMNDLGLDSLDQVELVMAMEDEFGFEIPDSDAEKLLRPVDVIKYVAERQEIPV